jgi:zinc D-Ala-D-Ala carboxypeptidase
MKISNHMALEQAVSSQIAKAKGIDNTPGQAEKGALALTAKKVYDPVCQRFGKVYISSGYRSPALNVAVGGSKTSAHTRGEALDLDGRGPSGFVNVSNSDLFHYIRENLEFDQLISEFNQNGEPAWVHVSFRSNGNRQQVLLAYRDGDETKFVQYTPKLWNRMYKFKVPEPRNVVYSDSGYVETDELVDSRSILKEISWGKTSVNTYA